MMCREKLQHVTKLRNNCDSSNEIQTMALQPNRRCIDRTELC